MLKNESSLNDAHKFYERTLEPEQCKKKTQTKNDEYI
jgi:hypothetical protein